jgi:hypothetical protein
MPSEARGCVRRTRLHLGRLQEDAHFDQPPRYAEYLTAVRRLDEFARQRYGKRVIHLAVRWLLDQRATAALWGARQPGQLQPIDEVFGWSLDAPQRPRSIASGESRSSTRWAPTSWRRLCAPMRESWKWRISKLASRQIRNCWRCSWKSWARAFPSSC